MLTLSTVVWRQFELLSVLLPNFVPQFTIQAYKKSMENFDHVGINKTTQTLLFLLSSFARWAVRQLVMIGFLFPKEFVAVHKYTQQQVVKLQVL